MKKSSQDEVAVKLPFGKQEFMILGSLLFIAFIVRLALFPLSGYKNDTATFAYWFNTAATVGPRAFYTFVYASQGWVDYPPLNVYIFWGFGSLTNALSLSGTALATYIIKLPPNLFDMATAFVVYAFIRKRSSMKMALLATSLYAFNPAVIFNAAVWGQFDAIYTFFMVLSLFLVSEAKPKLAAVAFMLSVLTKPQAVALTPIMVFLIYRKYNWKGLLTSVLASIATIFVVILPFEWVGGNPISFLSKIYFGAYGMYQETSVNAFNFWGLGGVRQSDLQVFFFLNLYTIGWILFASAAAFTLYFAYKKFGTSEELVMLFGAFVLFFSFFMLPTRIHERYIFPALSVLALMLPFIKKMRPLYAVLTATCLINQAYVLAFLNSPNPFISASDPIAFTVSLINSGAFLYVIMLMVGELRGNKWLKPSPAAKSADALEEGSER